jgi:hypothetical protein
MPAACWSAGLACMHMGPCLPAQDYYGNDMPWLAVPYEKATIRTSLSRRHSVLGIPCLVILGPDGKVGVEGAFWDAGYLSAAGARCQLALLTCHMGARARRRS